MPKAETFNRNEYSRLRSRSSDVAHNENEILRTNQKSNYTEGTSSSDFRSSNRSLNHCENIYSQRPASNRKPEHQQHQYNSTNSNQNSRSQKIWSHSSSVGSSNTMGRTRQITSSNTNQNDGQDLFSSLPITINNHYSSINAVPPKTFVSKHFVNKYIIWMNFILIKGRYIHTSSMIEKIDFSGENFKSMAQ